MPSPLARALLTAAIALSPIVAKAAPLDPGGLTISLEHSPRTFQANRAIVLTLTVANSSTSEAWLPCSPVTYLTVWLVKPTGATIEPNLAPHTAPPCPRIRIAPGKSTNVAVPLTDFQYALKRGHYRIRIALGTYETPTDVEDVTQLTEISIDVN